MKELQEIPVWIWIILAVVLLLQGTWLFRDARDRGQGGRPGSGESGDLPVHRHRQYVTCCL